MMASTVYAQDYDLVILNGRVIDLDKLNFEIGAPVQVFDMAKDISASGEVSAKFRPTKPIDFYKEGSTLDWKPAH